MGEKARRPGGAAGRRGASARAGAWIRVPGPSEIGPGARAAYEDLTALRGAVPPFFRAQALHGAALRAHARLYRALVFGTGETTVREREMIALAVSAANGCRFGMGRHEERLRSETGDEALGRVIARDWRRARLSPRERAMLDYSVAMARRPDRAERSRVEAMRAAGLTDRGILEVALLSAYYAMANRIALGLGVGEAAP